MCTLPFWTVFRQCHVWRIIRYMYGRHKLDKIGKCVHYGKCTKANFHSVKSGTCSLADKGRTFAAHEWSRPGPEQLGVRYVYGMSLLVGMYK